MFLKAMNSVVQMDFAQKVGIVVILFTRKRILCMLVPIRCKPLNFVASSPSNLMFRYIQYLFLHNLEILRRCVFSFL